jgi:membrane protein implicated in regulation of membrane protease activity
MGWEIQIAVFSVLSVLGVGVARRFFKLNPIHSDQPLLNRRTAQYIGRVFTLSQPIVNGLGKIKVDDSTWKVRGEDCPVGTQVTVVDADSVVLIVKKTGDGP